MYGQPRSLGLFYTKVFGIFYPNLGLSPLPTQTTAIYLSLLAISRCAFIEYMQVRWYLCGKRDTKYNLGALFYSFLWGVNSLEVMTKQSVRFLILSGESIFQGFIFKFVYPRPRVSRNQYRSLPVCFSFQQIN